MYNQGTSPCGWYCVHRTSYEVHRTMYKVQGTSYSSLRTYSYARTHNPYLRQNMTSVDNAWSLSAWTILVVCLENSWLNGKVLFQTACLPKSLTLQSCYNICIMPFLFTFSTKTLDWKEYDHTSSIIFCTDLFSDPLKKTKKTKTSSRKLKRKEKTPSWTNEY